MGIRLRKRGDPSPVVPTNQNQPARPQVPARSGTWTCHVCTRHHHSPKSPMGGDPLSAALILRLWPPLSCA